MEGKDEKIEIEVIDLENRVYKTGEKIGQGGQGAVFRVKGDGDIAVKLACDVSGEPLTSDEAIKNLSDKLKSIRVLPLPKNINLSKPLAILKSHAGYVMSFMQGMKSFDFFLKLNEQVTEEELPNWLKTAEGKAIPDAEIWINYCKTGGLRDRLLSLYKISEQIAALHSNGLVYGDISTGNLMFKKDGEKITAGLIDADNINFAGKSKTYYTHGYGAPEVVTNKSSATIFSDAYAFAVAAFYIITMMHPFKGSKVLGEANDDDWANSVATQQKADPKTFKDDGSFPWIFDADDDSNAYGSLEQVNSLFLTPTLFALFDNTFAEGHTRPNLRTPISRWASAFAEAADLTIKCPSCKMTYFYENKENGKYCCPYCNFVRPVMLLAKSKINTYSHEIADKTILPRRCFEAFRTFSSDEGILSLELKNNFLEISSVAEHETICITENGGEEEILTGKHIFSLSDLQSGKISLSFYIKKEFSYTVSLEFYGEKQ